MAPPPSRSRLTTGGTIFKILALGAMLAAPAVSANCCRAKNPTDGSVCHGSAAVTLQECQMNPQCMWTTQCGLRNSAVADAVNLGAMAVYFIGAICFALCCEKARRWAMGMEGFWPAGRTRNGRFRRSLFTCCGCNANCWRSCCCPLIMGSFNRAHLEKRQWQCSELCCGLGLPVIFGNRQAIRQKLDVTPQPCEDCLTMCCCLPCAVAQHTLEIEDGFPEDGQGLTSRGAETEMTSSDYAPPGARGATAVPTATPVNYA